MHDEHSKTVAVAESCGGKHAGMDEYGKTNGMTIVFAAWHPNPQYRIFKTGSLLSRNEEYPSGLIMVDERGVPRVWQSPGSTHAATWSEN